MSRYIFILNLIFTIIMPSLSQEKPKASFLGGASLGFAGVTYNETHISLSFQLFAGVEYKKIRIKYDHKSILPGITGLFLFNRNISEKITSNSILLGYSYSLNNTINVNGYIGIGYLRSREYNQPYPNYKSSDYGTFTRSSSSISSEIEFEYILNNYSSLMCGVSTTSYKFGNYKYLSIGFIISRL